jgi:hypothetical protein
MNKVCFHDRTVNNMVARQQLTNLHQLYYIDWLVRSFENLLCYACARKL